MEAMQPSLPLTAALSPSEGEREKRRQPGGEASGIGNFAGRTLLFPLPIGWGEGHGEGPFAVAFGTT